MDEKTRLQIITLQVLSLVGLFLGRLPKVQTVVDILTHVVTEHWEEIFSLTQKKAAGKKLVTAAKKELAKDGGMAFATPNASREVRDVLDRVADEFGQGGEEGDKTEAASDEAPKKNGSSKAGFRH